MNLKDRLKEPSTFASIGGGLMVAAQFLQENSDIIADHKWSLLALHAASALAFGLGIIKREGKLND